MGRRTNKAKKMALSNEAGTCFKTTDPRQNEAPPVMWEENEMWPEEIPEEVPNCECCGEYLYNGPICPNCRGLI